MAREKPKVCTSDSFDDTFLLPRPATQHGHECPRLEDSSAAITPTMLHRIMTAWHGMSRRGTPESM